MNLLLALQVPDGESSSGGSAQPVSVGGEHQGVDDVVSVQGVQVLTLVQVPEHRGTVLASGGAERAVGGDGHGVDVAGVSDEVLGELELFLEGPHLDEFVPSGGDDDGLGGVGGELDAGDPVGVASAGFGVFDDVFAFTEDVPEAEGLVSGSRDDLTIVSGEGNGEDILLVTHKAARGVSGVQVPQTEVTIPRCRQSEVSIFGDDDVFNVVGVTPQGTVGSSVLFALIISRETGEVPLHDSLVTGSRQDHVGTGAGGGNGGDPSVVST